jgi:hypothetical protein
MNNHQPGPAAITCTGGSVAHLDDAGDRLDENLPPR